MKLLVFRLAIDGLAGPRIGDSPHFARADPVAATAGGVIAFAGATTVCAVAESLGVLIAARAAQAAAGALVIVGSLELLVEATGADRAGVRRWAVISASAMEDRPPLAQVSVEWLSQAAGPASAEEIDRRRSRRPRPGSCTAASCRAIRSSGIDIP